MDADLVVDDWVEVRDVLEQIGFERAELAFQLHHADSDVLIELVGEEIQVVEETWTPQWCVRVRRSDIADPRVRELMPGPATTLDPTLVFLAYADTAQEGSEWFDARDAGSHAKDRATALLSAYREIIVAGLQAVAHRVPEGLLSAIRLEYDIP